MGIRSRRQPADAIDEVIGTGGFARNNEDGRNADRPLANRCVHATSQVTHAEIGERCGLDQKRMKWPASTGADTGPREEPTMEHIGIDLGSKESQICVRSAAGEICWNGAAGRSG